MKFSKEQVEDYFNMKVGRAVDRIFCENNVKSIYDFYATLQDCKKNNTLSLRKTLEQNYDKMLYCSDLMDKVKDYAGEVKNIANQISQELHQQKGNNNADNEQGHEIMRIENKIQKGEFVEALIEVKKWMHNGESLKPTDRYYLKYLKLEVVTKMQKHMNANAMIKKYFLQYAECLHELIFEPTNGNKQFTFSPNLEKLCKDHKVPSILALIEKNRLKTLQTKAGLQQKQNTPILSQNQCKKICMEVLFEYKLYLLSKQCKGTLTSKPFEQYFQDLVTLLSQTIEGPEFHTIFVQSIPNIKRQLATIFISRNNEGQIIFNCDLYDHLIKSEPFQNVLQQFHSKMIESGSDIQNPIAFIRELWHDYFINLIDYSFDLLSPLPIVQKLTMYSMPPEKVPPELRAYLYDKSIENSIASLEEYHNKLSLFHKNIVPTVERCTPSQKEKMSVKFTEKVEALLEKAENNLYQLLEGKIMDLNLRKFILLCSLLESLFEKCGQINKIEKLWKDPIDIETFISHKFEVGKFYSVFTAKLERGGKNFHYSFVDFDAFLVGYIEGTQNNEIKSNLKLILKTICLKVLDSLKEQFQDREKDLIGHTSESIRKGQEKITVMDYILMPYLAQFICNCEINESKIDENLFKKYFSSSKKTEYSEIVEVNLEEEPDDDFEIGEKDEGEEFVKIGKSFLTAGTNFISGFMPKKK